MARSKPCEMCISAPSKDYCVNCEQYFCGRCTILHGRLKIARNHVLKSGRIIDALCEEHSEVLTSFCSDCNIRVCKTCILGTHKEHKLSSRKENASKSNDRPALQNEKHEFLFKSGTRRPSISKSEFLYKCGRCGHADIFESHVE